MIKNIIRALRLPFLAASVLPFIFGSLAVRKQFNFPAFTLGLLAAAFTHLSANLINDYADSKSGADWQDIRFYGFFGGSKLIQEKVLSEGFYRNAALLCALFAFLSVAALASILNNAILIPLYILVVVLSWQYSARPLQFSYRMLGEFFIFLLFGPLLVMGGYFIQSGIFPGLKGLILSLPFGFFTTAILFANEVPDFSADMKAQKRTWVSVVGQKNSFVLYYALTLAGFLSVSVGIYKEYLAPLAALSFVFIFPAVRAMNILKRHYLDKDKLVQSSRLTIMMQFMVSVILILGIRR